MTFELSERDRDIVIAMLIESIEKAGAGKVELVEQEAPKKSPVQEVKNILRLVNSRMVATECTDGIYLSGESDINECIDLTNKLMASGFIRTPNVIIEDNSYLGFIASDRQTKILLEKPNK